MAFGGVNYPAILMAAAASWLFGAAWYMALSKPWMQAAGYANQEAMLGPDGKVSPAPFILSFVAELMMAWVLAGVIGHLGPGQATLANGVISGLFVWLGFVITTMAVNNAYTRRRPALTLIDGGHWLGVLMLQGAILGWMGG